VKNVVEILDRAARIVGDMGHEPAFRAGFALAAIGQVLDLLKDEPVGGPDFSDPNVINFSTDLHIEDVEAAIARRRARTTSR
jgi:hypothetical protein